MQFGLHARKIPLVFIPVLLGFISTALFFLQGGFGGGHSPLDSLIVLLMLPSVYICQFIPLPQWMENIDLTYTVIFPTLLNTALVWLVCGVVRIVRNWNATRQN